jgi:hypothetical protein
MPQRSMFDVLIVPALVYYDSHPPVRDTESEKNQHGLVTEGQIW